MPKAINNDFNPTPNPGTSSPANLSGAAQSQIARVGVNQIHGTAVAGSTGSGIPKAVTSVSANIANASAGATSTVTVMFHRDPSDSSFVGVKILAKGYQGNNTAVQVGSSADSPATFILSNTGESVSLIVQPYGNGGSTPLANCPSVGIKLPKSAGGGVGTTTTTQVVTGSSLTGDVTTSGGVATVVGIQGKPVRSGAPIQGDFLWFDGADWGPNWFSSIVGNKYEQGGGSTGYYWQGQVTGQTNANSAVDTAPTATEPPSLLVKTPTTASTLPFGYSQNVAGTTLGVLKRWQTRAKAPSSANSRYWIGLSSQTSPLSSVLFNNDTPALSMCAFRWSAGVDTNWQAVCCNGTTRTIVDCGVAPDVTNSQLFDIIFDGTNVKFYINRTLVATISTNLPATSTLMPYLVSVNNKNSANQVSIQLFYTYYQEK